MDAPAMVWLWSVEANMLHDVYWDNVKLIKMISEDLWNQH